MSQRSTIDRTDYDQERIIREAEIQKEKSVRNTRKKNPVENILFKFNNYTRKTSKNIPLLQNISFEIPEGALVALMGLSGEGKSTLFESISGRCSESHITYGEVLTKNSSNILTQRDSEKWRKRVNYHMQEITQYRKINVYSLLCSIAKCYRKDTEIIDKLLSYFRVSKTKHTLFSKLSGGEQKRIMTIIGIISEKELNLWDEPLTGLDSEIAKKTLRFMKNRKTTNIVSIHQPSEGIMSLFDWIVFMNNSTVVYAGPYASIEEYFEKKGIRKTENILFIDYLMRLSAENAETQEDTENIHRLNRITEDILLRPQGPETEKNIFITNSYSISLVRVQEILRRSMYFDRGFKGSSIIFEVAYYLFWLFILTVGSIVAERTIFSYENGFIKRVLFEPIYEMIDILQGYTGDSTIEIEKYKELLLECLNSAVNAKWLSGTIYFLQTERAFTFMSMISLYSTLFSIDYYRLCKVNIAEGQFTAGDFMLAQMIDVCVRKISLGFLFSTISYYLLYSTFIDETVEGYLGPNMIEIVAVSVVGSICLGLYVLAVHISPISSKMYIYAGSIMLLCMQTTILQLESLSYFLDSNLHRIFNDMINGKVDMNNISKNRLARENHPFYDLKLNMLHNKKYFLDSLAKRLETDEGSFGIKSLFTRAISRVLKTLYRMGPFGIHEELLTKLQMYKNRIYRIEDAGSLAEHLIVSTEFNIDENSVIEIGRRHNTIAYINDMSKDLNIHELLLPKEFISEVTVGDLVITAIRGLFLPICLLVVVGIIKYRKIQPKIRN